MGNLAVEVVPGPDRGPISLTMFRPKFKFYENLFAGISFLTIGLLHIFAHATTAVLLWHVQNFVVIILLEFEWEQNEISVEFWL